MGRQHTNFEVDCMIILPEFLILVIVTFDLDLHQPKSIEFFPYGQATYQSLKMNA